MLTRPRLNACRASRDVSRDLIERGIEFFSGGNGFAQFFAHLASSLTERFQHLFLAISGSFRARHGVAGAAIHGAQFQNILFAQVGDGAVESGNTSDALAQVSGNLRCDALVGRLAHQA